MGTFRRARDIRGSRKVARKKTALAVGAIAACVLPGALAGSSAPPKFPTDCIKQATRGKCLAGDKLFGDKPDPDAVEGIKDLLSEPLMIGRDDVHEHDEPTLGGGIKAFVRRAARKRAAVKRAALKKADAAADDTKLDAPKTLDDNDAQDDKEDSSTQDMTHTADDHEYPSDMSADEHAADEHAAEEHAAEEHAAEEESMKDKVSEIKAGFQGCDLSAIAQCMIDSDAQEAQAKGKEINDLIASPMWKSAPVECSYPAASGGKPSCEDFMKKKPIWTLDEMDDEATKRSRNAHNIGSALVPHKIVEKYDKAKKDYEEAVKAKRVKKERL